MFRTIGEGILELEPEYRYDNALSPWNQIGRNLGAATAIGFATRSVTNLVGLGLRNGSQHVFNYSINKNNEIQTDVNKIAGKILEWLR